MSSDMTWSWMPILYNADAPADRGGGNRASGGGGGDGGVGGGPTGAAAPDEFDLSESVVLIVDDNQQNLELLQAYLEALPCRLFTALDGLEAIAFIEDPAQPAPDLILLDVMMPRMSGFEVCQKLKTDPATRSIPIMMVTALNELGDIERGVEAGTDDFVSKPVNKLELLTRVKSLLRVRHLKRELDRTEAYLRRIEQRDEG
ncbi:MAG: response regulator [Phycisphaeraceae bacterium]